MSRSIEADICVIGASPAGLAVAAGSAQLGARTVLIDRGSGRGHHRHLLPRLLLTAARDGLDYAVARQRAQDTLDQMAAGESLERYAGMGVTVVTASASFLGPRAVLAGEHYVDARRIVIATGTLAGAPPIPGLDTVPYLTAATVLECERLPYRLAVVGDGPAEIALAQAYRYFGVEVTVIAPGAILPGDDPELVAVLRQCLQAEGIAIVENASIRSIAGDAAGIALTTLAEQAEQRIETDAILVALVHQPDIAALDLAKAGVAVTANGITADRRLRSSNRRIYVVGDSGGRSASAHLAAYQANIVLANALFRRMRKIDERAIPHLVPTEPALARTGLGETEARAALGRKLRVLRWPYRDNDRARAEERSHGLVKILARRNGKIVGAAIVGAEAGELIQTWGLAIGAGLRVDKVAALTTPLLSFGEINRRGAASFAVLRLLRGGARRLMRLLALLD